MLKELRKQRLLAAKQKQKETKERREQERNERAEKWRARKAQEIVYLGTEVSAGLNNFVCDETRLQKYGLPRFDDAAQIAAAMHITVNELRFLTFDRKTSSVNHYVRFKMPKKTGGERLISAPMPRLKKAQQWILTNLLDKVALHDAAHGFRQARSIVSNAEPHVGAEVIINCPWSAHKVTAPFLATIRKLLERVTAEGGPPVRLRIFPGVGISEHNAHLPFLNDLRLALEMSP